MLFTARSQTAHLAPTESRDGSPTGIARIGQTVPFQLPWLACTYLVSDDSAATSYWETVCGTNVFDFVRHLRANPKAKVAELLFMLPPRGPTTEWMRRLVRRIEIGTVDGSEILVFSHANGDEFCADLANTDPQCVKQRKVLLSLSPVLHFD